MQDIMEFARINTLWSIGWVGLTIAFIYTAIKYSLSKVSEIGNTQATMIINQQNGIVVDVRPHDAYRNGHIVDSINITQSEIMANNLGALEKHKSAPIITVCANGSTGSRDAAGALSKLGFEQVYMLKDGIMGWSGDNLPLVRQKNKQ